MGVVDGISRPDDGWMQFERAASGYKQSKPKKADRIYRRGLAKHPRSADLLNNYACFLLSTTGEPDASEALLRRAIEADPGHPHTLCSLGRLYQHQRDDEGQARVFFEQAVVRGGDLPGVLSNYASFLAAIGDDAAAEPIFERSLAADPGDVPALGNYAMLVWRRHRDARRADELLALALAHEPSNPELLAMYAGFAVDHLEDPDRTEELLARALPVNPGDAELVGDHASFLWFVRGDRERARTEFERSLCLERRPTVLHNYATFRSMVDGESDEVRRLYEEILELRPESVETLTNLAALHLRLGGDDDHAEELLRRAVAIDPPHAHALAAYAGFLRVRRGDRVRSRALLEQALALDPDHPDALVALGAAQIEAGDLSGLAQLDRAERTFPYWLTTGRNARSQVAFIRAATAWTDPDARARALVELRAELRAGTRSPLNDLAALVERVRVGGADEAHLALLASIIEVISGRRAPEELDADPIWRELPPDVDGRASSR